MDPVANPNRGSAFVYFAFFVFGIAGLMPWNLFITARHYFDYKLSANATAYEHMHLNRTYLQKTFESAFTVTGSITGLTGVIVNACVATKISNTNRMLTGVLMVMLSIVPCTVLALVDTSQWQILFFVLTLLLLNAANFGSNGFISAASFGLAARFPHKYLTIQLTGQAFAGIGTSLASILSQAVTPDPQWNGFAYFIVALIFTAFSGLVYAIMLKTPFYKSHTIDMKYEPLRRNSDDANSNADFVESCTVVDSDELPLLSEQMTTPRLYHVIRKMRYACLYSILIYSATLACFPGLASLAVSTHLDPVWRIYFIPVSCFLLYNVGDAAGRYMGGHLLWPSRGGFHFTILAVLRYGFIAFFMVSDLRPKFLVPTYIYNDWIYSGVVLIVGLSNGHLITRASHIGIQQVDKHENELAGAVLAAFGVFGVAVGSALSFILVSVV